MTTKSHPISKEEFLAFSAAWRAHAAAKKNSASDHLLLAILRGKDPLRAFSPVTNATKLSNGQSAHEGLERAIEKLKIPAGLSRNHTQHLLQLSEPSFERLQARFGQAIAALRQGAAQ